MADLRVARDHIHRAQGELEQAQRLLSADIMKNPTATGQRDVQHAQLVDLHRQVSAALATLLARGAARG